MSTNVIRIARLLGGYLGSPFFHDLNIPERLWNGPHLQVDACTMNPEHVDPPAPDCHCGMWAAVSQGALQRCLVAMHRNLSGAARFMNEVHDKLPDHKLTDPSSVATPGQIAAVQQQRTDWALVKDHPHGWDWTPHAIVGCRTLDPRSEPACLPGLNYPGGQWDEEVRMRQLRLRCGRAEAVRNLHETDTPRDWRRYRHLLITHIWISDALAEYAPDLEKRYNAQVITAPNDNGGWLTRFMRTGHLPGLEAPSGAQRRTTMTAAEVLMAAKNGA